MIAFIFSGFSTVKANDMDEAISITKECPVFNYPDIVVEVREVMNIECS
ncbi:MAG: hypothetical protein V3U87_18275 [Methylococcaceae bacterium]